MALNCVMREAAATGKSVLLQRADNIFTRFDADGSVSRVLSDDLPTLLVNEPEDNMWCLGGRHGTCTSCSPAMLCGGVAEKDALS